MLLFVEAELKIWSSKRLINISHTLGEAGLVGDLKGRLISECSVRGTITGWGIFSGKC